MHIDGNEGGSSTLSHTTVLENTQIAKEELLRQIKCSCTSDTPCINGSCGCKRTKLACTDFCARQEESDWFSDFTKRLLHAQNGDA